jgi:hypothetical protein
LEDEVNEGMLSNRTPWQSWQMLTEGFEEIRDEDASFAC